MLMNHMNFHFIQIPDKTNDVIFLKSPKTLLWDHFFTIFGHFCVMRIFSKKSSSVTQAPNTMLRFTKKTNEPILRNLTDRRKDGRTDPIL